MNRSTYRVFLGIVLGFILFVTDRAEIGFAEERSSIEHTSDPVPYPIGYNVLDHLPTLPNLHAVDQYSSHNKQGMNGDSNWRLYDDSHGDAVLFDVAGPGCIRSIWSTNFAADAVFKFYFDGAEVPRFEIPMLDFFQGKHPLFPAPLNSYEHRGRWGEKPYAGNSFVPIPFAKGLKITAHGEFNFYHILFNRYPHGTEVTTFTGREDRRHLLAAFDDPAALLPEPSRMQIHSAASEQIEPGVAVALLDRKEPGLIRQIVIEGEGSDAFLQDVFIQIRWDHHLYFDVQAPLGFFFGSAVHPTPLQSLPVQLEKMEGGRIRLVSRFPGPFWEHASIHLVNHGSSPLGPVQAKIFLEPLNLAREQSGYLTTCYRQGTTTYGRDWLLFESPGTGWFVGAVQSMRMEHYCEGDEHFYVDGAVAPQIHGTGSEDYYLGCFWPNRNYNSPFANCVGDIQEEGGGTFEGSYSVPSCYSRFHLEAPIPFFNRIDARIQHGGLNTIASHYGSLAFAYLRPRPALDQTDFLKVGAAASEQAHGYRASHSKSYGPITAFPEGQYFTAPIRDLGRIHEDGTIVFTVAVHPNNQGIRLRRRLDQGQPRQTAEVRIDGQPVGTWYHPDQNEYLRWFDSDFDIHPKYTASKDRIQVILKVHTEAGRGPFTDFQYEVFSWIQ